MHPLLSISCPIQIWDLQAKFCSFWDHFTTQLAAVSGHRQVPEIAIMVVGPRTFWETKELAEPKKSRKGRNLRDFCGFCFLRLGGQS